LFIAIAVDYKLLNKKLEILMNFGNESNLELDLKIIHIEK
jgi:hypothetical protein